MPGGDEKQLKRRIKSVENTKQVTKAMEMVAAARLPKAQERVAAARPYSEQITEVIRSLAQAGADLDHPLLAQKDEDEVQKVAYVIITSDRGLAGGYNNNVLRAATSTIEDDRAKGRDYSLVLVGKKAESYYRFRGYEIDASFTGMSEKPTYEDARTVATAVSEPFEEGDIDLVRLVYTRFLSVGTQRVAVRQLLPLDTEALAEDADDDEDGPEAAYEFEPTPTEILERLLPRYVEARLYAAMLEASASELAARQRAMKAASDNAGELIDNLNRDMNRARQATITTEIMEVVGGAEALRGGKKKKDYFPDDLVTADYLPDHYVRS
ncbi:MAG: F0F1 ATP synthase subunit gamma [Actinomycetota bacterium]|nr:F0F1 ATP synthase subunit gamma [Actinomycetota bacterium]MDQ3574394.1 F0F1 ATP synthase subunit gamma [Actinomycetota bacterium]